MSSIWFAAAEKRNGTYSRLFTFSLRGGDVWWGLENALHLYAWSSQPFASCECIFLLDEGERLCALVHKHTQKCFPACSGHHFVKLSDKYNNDFHLFSSLCFFSLNRLLIILEGKGKAGHHSHCADEDGEVEGSR